MRNLTLFLCLICGVLFAQVSNSFYFKLAQFAENRTSYSVQYDPSYYEISYPNGDIPSNKGVCTDVVIRAYRQLGIDLQKLVHEDMKTHFNWYPKIWGARSTDTNIDHRRVPNLMVFLNRMGAKIEGNDYQNHQFLPGDIVCWNLNGGKSFYGITHIGIVSTQKTITGHYKIVHNIGSGPQIEDVLFDYNIIGHYRFQP